MYGQIFKLKENIRLLNYLTGQREIKSGISVFKDLMVNGALINLSCHVK